ncbi:NrfD/PsrC family molybdoenzyme membrane anchor subunit [Mobilicoccus caccae]|uniref:Oxidoreductase n=1 Tax=Mobilicoccus caccae TaxID=1859295 RepID=A0ABQ6IMJ9_9MICO|nr:NrfD/PsrC family molybdoenzyme membrane anchor subunit [Mobilicoccus caccae]GMA39147.1 oxidoreductase [Mobilicoccus caccae]
MGPRPPHRGVPHPRARTIWYAVLLVALAVGSWGLYNRVFGGLATTDLTSTMPWGAWVAFYIYFVGLSAGAFLVSSLIYVFGMHQFERIGRAALLSAIVSMGVALCFIGADLGRMERAPITMIFFHWTSPLSWEVRFYVLYIALLVTELVIAIRVQRRLVRSVERAHRWMRILGTIGVPLAIFGVHGGTGTIFAVVKARAMWFGGLFPVIFVVSAMVSGTALLIAVHYWQARGAGRRPDRVLIRNLSTVLLAAVLIDLGLTFYEFVVPLLAFEHHDQNIITLQAFGPYAWTFWIIQMGMGMIIPAAIILSPLKKRTGAIVAAAMICVVGIVGVRFNIVVPPLIPPVIEGYPTGDYYPTLNEWLLSMFFIAGGALVYSLVSEWQPIHEPDPDDHAALAADRGEVPSVATAHTEKEALS